MGFSNITKRGFMSGQEYVLSTMTEYIEFIAYSIICFLVPFLLSHPQLLVGIVVNASLILAALNIKNYKLIPIIVLPSVAVLSKGVIFGPYSVFLLYIIPFIWIGNACLVLFTKYFMFKKYVNKFLAVGLAIVTKIVILFVAAYVLVSLGIIPQMFLTAMGLIQVYTAVAGAITAFCIQSAKKNISMLN